MRNQRGFTGLEIVAVVAIIGVVAFVAPKLNIFNNSADPANRRTASAISGRDIVDITNAVSDSEKPVTVHIDRSVEAKSEITDPKLTVGQRIGRFFGGLSTWAVLLIIGGLAAGVITPMGLLTWSRHVWKSAFKNTVAGIRDMDDEEAYKKATRSIAVQQNKRDKKLTDKVKSELH